MTREGAADRPLEAVEVLGVPVHAVTLEELLDWVDGVIKGNGRAQVMYANVHTVNAAWSDAGLRRIFRDADVVYCDGAGVRWGARVLGQELPARMTGADWIHRLSEACQGWGYWLYFLGGEPGVASAASENLGRCYPGLGIAGTHHGYFDAQGEENEALVAAINAARPDILFVGLGTPLQERWIAANFDRLEVPVVWAVGALMDFVSETVPRAPRWMTDHGLEWLGRLAVEPRRLWKRYLIGNPLFVWRVLRQRWGRR